MFLKLGIPILATVVSSVVNSIDQIGEVPAAAMVREPIRDFRTFLWSFWETLAQDKQQDEHAEMAI